MEKLKKYGPYALVTGASRGIGREVTLLLAEMGFNLVLVARNLERLHSIQKEVETKYNVVVQIFDFDLTDTSAIYTLFENTQKLDIGLIVPNAGDILVGSFANSDASRTESIMNLNITHPTLLTHLFIERFLKRQHSAVLLLASTFGFQGVPYFSTYAATKSYILNLGEALHYELRPFGIDVTVLSPGLTITDMSKNLPMNFKKLPLLPSLSKEVARQGLNNLGNKSLVVPGLVNKIFILFNRVVPRTFPTWLFGKLIQNAFHKDKLEDILNKKEVGNE